MFGDIQRIVSVNELAKDVQGVYETLSDHTHSNKFPSEYSQVASGKLEIVEGQLSKRQCRASECVCQAFGFPTDLKLNTASHIEECCDTHSCYLGQMSVQAVHDL